MPRRPSAVTPDTTPAHTYAYRGLDAQLTRVAAAVESGELDGRRSTTVCALAARAGRIRFVLTRKHAVAAKVPHATRQTVVVSSRQEGVVDHRPVRTREELTPIHTQTYDFLLISKSKTP